MVALATLPAPGGACLQNIPSQARIVLIFLAALLHGIEDVNQGVGGPALALDASYPRRTAPSSTLAMVAGR